MNGRDYVPIGSLISGGIIAIFLHLFFPWQRVIPYPFNFLGLALIVAGFWLIGTALSVLIRHKTDFRPSGSPSALVTSGPFRYSRNPIYLGNMIILAGISVLLGTLSPFFVIVLFFIIMRTLVIPFEEKRLAATFPEAYREYRAKVRRWF